MSKFGEHGYLLLYQYSGMLQTFVSYATNSWYV